MKMNTRHDSWRVGCWTGHFGFVNDDALLLVLFILLVVDVVVVVFVLVVMVALFVAVEDEELFLRTTLYLDTTLALFCCFM